MTEEKKIIELLRSLNKNSNAQSNEEKFLKNLRVKLSNRILEHSVIKKSSRLHIPWYLKFSLSNTIVIPQVIALPHMPHIITMQQKTIAIIFVICFLGFTTIAAASQRSLPGETLYPIKILSEEVQSSLVFSAESRAAIQFDFAARRVAEVKAILEQKDINQEGLDIALTNLQKNADSATAIIDEESQKGNDIAKAAKNTSDTLIKNTADLNQLFDRKNKDLAEEEDSLQDKIEKAKKNDEQEKITSLNVKLDETRNKRKSLESTWDKSKETLNKNTHKIENQLKEKESSNENKTQIQKNNSQEKNKNKKKELNTNNDDNDNNKEEEDDEEEKEEEESNREELR